MMPPRNTAVAGLVAGIIALTASSAPSATASRMRLQVRQREDPPALGLLRGP